jgi:sensor histidine kinase YesM
MKEMVSKVKGLKIDIYEKTLEQQKTKMDFLTLQIEPHFYLNCLNIIFNMAQMEDYQNIQKLSTCVSEYLRYIFRIGENMVTIKDELNHIEKYLEIQKIRYRNGFDTSIQIEENILNAKIPPLILQTFVENVIKHAVTLEEPVSLMITGSKEGSTGEEKVVIYIEDTGEGFDKNILDKLQSGIDISESDKRIGVMNAISRLHLAFPMEADISFYNRESGGAAVKISFPYSKE